MDGGWRDAASANRRVGKAICLHFVGKELKTDLNISVFQHSSFRITAALLSTSELPLLNYFDSFFFSPPIFASPLKHSAI